MADKANKYEIGAAYVTMVAGAGIAYDATQKNGSAHIGKAVMISAEDTVDLVSTGSEIFGKLMKVEPDGFCTVQYDGYCDVPSTGAITYGGGLVGGATAGTVATAAAVPAAGALRNARAIKSDGVNRVIMYLV